MSIKLIDEILSLVRERGAELPYIELKINNTKPDEIGEYISAISNSASINGEETGYIVWGVEDSTLDISGTVFEPSTTSVGSQPLVDWLSNLLSPFTYFEFKSVGYRGKKLVLCQIDRARTAPVKFKNTAFIRIDSCKRKLEKYPELVRKLWSLNPNDDWSAGICVDAKLSDLDTNAIKKAREEFKIRNSGLACECDKWDDLTFLNKAKFSIQGSITRTAIILLGKSESEHFLQPAWAKLSWILKDKDGVEIDYEHFGPPLIISVEKVFNKIRNLNYRYLQDNTLFPTEISQYDSWIIREALHNCIAHQDYTLAGKVNIIEMPDYLVFSNVGKFIPSSIEEVVRRDSPEEIYRNRFLCDAMVNCGMIDTIGSGIKRMFTLQKNRFFPLPNYEIKRDLKPTIALRIEGKILDPKYSRILIEHPEIDLETTMVLDKVQRKEKITRGQHQYLKKLRLVEGRYPNVFLSAFVAKKAGMKESYIRNKGFDDAFYKKQVLDYLKKFGPSSRSDIDNLLLLKLPDVLSSEQKKKKISNLLSNLRSDGTIFNVSLSRRHPKWKIC